jgi:hypothetical protein
MPKNFKVKKAFVGGIFKKNSPPNPSNNDVKDSSPTPSNDDVKDSSIKERFGRFLKGSGEKNKKLPDQYYNMNFTSLPGQSTNIPKIEGLDINVMDASKIKTMKIGGSVEIGKGKDYIKDLL